MSETIAHVLGPTGSGTYNVIVDDAISGFHALSLSLPAIAELHKQLGALLNGKVKDQTVTVSNDPVQDICKHCNLGRYWHSPYPSTSSAPVQGHSFEKA